MSGARSFEVLEPSGGLHAGVLLHVPHSSQTIPLDVRAGLLLPDAELRRELLLMTDHHTDALFARAVERGGAALVNRLSRLVVDPERFPDDADEPMARVGMGAVYRRTHDGRPLRSDDSAERSRLLAAYFQPYARAAADLVARSIDRFGHCLVIDGHSFPSRPLPYEPSQDPNRPALCIGTDPFHTPHSFVQEIERICCGRGVTTARNMPFTGAYVPNPFWRRERRVTAVMIEVRRDTYMDEATGVRSEAFAETRALIADIVDTVITAMEAG
jgi:N-formylglutamate amidohydrolase